MDKKKLDELVIANKELAFQNQEKKDRAAELVIANKELIFQNKEKEKRAAELVIANKELLFQNEEKENRAAELVIANKELIFQNKEKEKRAAELVIANKELAFQNKEKEKRAAELVIANTELLFQNEEKENRAAELIIANKELAFQNKEKEKRAAELSIADKELVFQNIEKKKRVAENKELEATSNAVKQASQYARSLIEASLDPFVTISPDGKITDVNEASVKVTGVPRLKLIGTDFSDYFTEPQKAREGYKQVFEKEFVSDYPLTIRHKNGKLTDVLYNASVYKDEKGNVLGVFAAARDVTVQKQASQYARSLIEASLDPLVTISPEGKITDVNEASVKVTGVPRLTLIGTDFSNYFTEPQKAREGYKQVFEKGFVSDYPLTIRHKNGKLTDVLYNASVYKDEKGDVLGVFAAARDVTQQKEAEEKIRQSEEMFKSIFDKSLAAVLVTDDEGNYISANKAAGELVGYSVNELLQMNVGDLKTTERPGAAKRFEEYMQKGEETGEFDFITKSGAHKFAQYQASRIKTDFNLSILMDITAQKHASQYARSLIEASLDPLVTISPEGKITDVNEASVNVTGVPRLKLIGTDFSDYFTEPQKAQEGYIQVFEKEFVSDYPLTIHHKNGKLTDVLYNASVYKDEKGNVLGVFAAARDVTAQKQASQYAESLIEALAESEKQFRNMMETIPQIAWTNTVDGDVTFYNQRWYDYTGLDYEKSKGWEWLSVIHPDDLQSTLDEYKLILKNNVGGEFQNRKRRVDGADRWHLVRLMPIKNEEGIVQLWTGTATDIHELRLLQQQKDDFISIASHELKTPITSLKASLQLLNRIKNDAASVMFPSLIEQANKSLEKVIILIKYLLDASNVNEGQLRLNQKLFTLSHIIEECCHSISIEGIYNVIIEGDMELQVYADAERINQVVINFITNAVKYAPESKEIRISIEKINVMAKVSIIDKGPGIAPEKLPYLFDRYYRADSSGSQYSGLGLGLYISSEIIKKHNGQIDVQSELGKGSTFWFTLPTMHIDWKQSIS